MKLVADANIAISAIIRADGKTRELLFRRSLEIFAPEVLLTELEAHRSEVLEKSSLSELEFSISLSRIFSNIHLIPSNDFGLRIPEAVRISPDVDNSHYLALALSLDCPVWSNDKRLKNQARVQVLATHELAKLLESALVPNP